MKIPAIQSHNKFSKHFANHIPVVEDSSQVAVNNTGTFLNTQNIISSNNICFHGLFGYDKNKKSSPEEKLNAAIQNLDTKSIVIFANDFENAKNLLAGQIQNIKFPMENIYFVQNTMNKGSFAVFKDQNARKYKIFKLYPLETIKIFDKEPDSTDKNINYKYVKTADEPEELNDHKYISFGPYKNESVIKTNFYNTSLRFVFEREVEKYSYLSTEKEIKQYNTTRLSSLQQNTGKKTSQIKKITFADIGAQDANIKELEKNVIFPVLYPDFYKKFRVNKGVLLYGPPRCGKTMLALALANELGVNYIKLGANDLTHAHVGKTEENWRNLFKQAIENQPTIIFIDEIDAIARSRGGVSDSARYKDDIVNQLLTLMSDLEKTDDKVFVIAATNKADLLDKALISSGRFGLTLEVKAPDFSGTKQIYDIHQKDKPFDNDIDKDSLCQKMFEKHFNGSDIAESFYIAHSFAMERLGIYDKMRNRTVCEEDLKNFKINQQDMENAIEKLYKQKSATAETQKTD